jgi:hypothetical protein
VSVFSEFQTRRPQPRQRLWWLFLLVLGPITGVLVGLCVASLKAGRPILAAGCVVALAAFWIGGPALLTAELSTLPAALKP